MMYLLRFHKNKIIIMYINKRMALSEIFTSSLLISLATTLLLVGLLGLYFTQKLAQQNHKISSMFELVSTLAGEVRNQAQKPVYSNENKVNKLIPVSDGEDELVDNKSNSEDEELSEENESDDEADDEEDSEDSDDADEDADNEEDADENNVDNEEDNEEDADEDNQEEKEEEDLQIKKINLDDLEELKIEEDDIDENAISVKSLDVELDYRKASLGRLRNLAVEKGFVKDASKLKKQDLLKLFE